MPATYRGKCGGRGRLSGGEPGRTSGRTVAPRALSALTMRWPRRPVAPAAAMVCMEASRERMPHHDMPQHGGIAARVERFLGHLRLDVAAINKGRWPIPG
jgi:hypothetical protein